ncbi:(R)-specific enoyl-CoA hydratase [Candidatus Izimaplasma bacterium HR1]|jgi:acyl dehydratase|uniref:MaoC family dehydratase n=1 Tax=Candidatus Izimoplasma sp. HR1 TaxID=1541959 RepID=UPI0004F5B0B8|nr:(R)-specific enoyl-CoA hydratase [Candidatus Izimaplasma bacterium HR1]
MIGKTINEINVGDKASQVVEIKEENVETFGKITNDFNPIHFDSDYAAKTIFKKRISHGMYVGSLFSKVFAKDLPGEGAIYIGQNFRFKRPVYFGDVIKAEVIVKELNIDRNRVYFDCVAYNQDNEIVITGEAEIMPPRKV